MNGCILLLAATFTLFSANEGDRKSWQLNPQTGKLEPVQAPIVSQPPATADAPSGPFGDPQLARIADLLKQSRFSQARRDAIDWLRDHNDSPVYDRGLYLAAEALRGNRELVKAFYYCDQLLDEHGGSSLYQDALELQYSIADEYLRGAKDTLLGVRLLERKDEAVEMLFRIQQRAPGSPVAEKALLRTADYYWANGDFDLAADAYHAYVQAYPRSPLVPQARLAEAKANLAQFHGTAFDSTSLLNAKTQMQQIAADYPDMAKEEGISEKLETADRQLARKLYENAAFYRRTGKKRAAATLCNRLLKLYPNVPEADDARKMLAQLEPTRPAAAGDEPTAPATP